MNEMFKRIAALLDGQAAVKGLLWGPARPQTARANNADDGLSNDDFRDTDVAVAWLCEASNRTRIKRRNEAQ
jgi:hypothetical protein